MKLCINGDKLKNSKKYILASNRPYQNVSINLTHDEYRVDELSYMNLKTIIRKFASTIMTVSTNHDISRLVDLPKLKSFHIRAGFSKSDRIYSTGFFSKLKYIERLTVEIPIIPIERKFEGMLANAIKNMERLKVLKCDSTVTNQLGDFSDYKFRLEEFHQLELSYNDLKIPGFLHCHRASIKMITTKRYSPSFLTDFPALTSLHIYDNSYSFSWYKDPLIEFPVNRTITQLMVKKLSLIDHSTLKNLLNLKTLIVDYLIHTEDLEVIFSIPTLKKVLYVDNFIFRCIPGMFESSITFERIPRGFCDL